ncbi:MAG: DNA-protecting protein DprA [Bacteroidales bacterium]|nr:DNA-protecting protein DprA [Bacteroidales bacterium]
MADNHLLYCIALSMIPGIGSKTARKLISLFGSPEQVFREKKDVLKKIPFIGNQLVVTIANKDILIKADKEINHLIRQNIQILYFTDPGYPARLNDCPDGPIIIHVKGKANLNYKRALSIVGTRSPTSYGTEVCRKLISEISAENQSVAIVSGLAYGIDICAHKSALRYGQLTVAVLGHGLGFLYPGAHRPIAGKIQESGALITDFAYGEKPERQNFIKRNRIIAGMSDATLVIESGTRGGALLTAQMADSYNKDVMAFPGRTSDPMSSGCNKMIKEHRATMIENWQDVKYFMGWDDIPAKTIQRELFQSYSDDENLILRILEKEGESSIDMICQQTGMPVKKISPLLLNLEFANEVIPLPGDRYKLDR